jgi:8-amino-7-oxononanoate synthase
LVFCPFGFVRDNLDNDVPDVVEEKLVSALIEIMAKSDTSYAAFLDGRRRDGLLRDLLPVDARDARTIRIGGETFVNFASNDYLGLRFHPALIDRSREWGERFGAGSGASRLVTGNLSVFAGIETKLAKLKRKPAALVMASGFQANAAVVQAVLDRSVLGAEPLVFADRLNHASMHFGCAAAGTREIRYRHGDAAHLAELLSQYRDDRPKFILTESVFSMDGDIAPLAEIGRLAREHAAMLIVDDAHATGILGEAGCGVSEGADVVIGTFSKALGSFGAYVACSEMMRDYLINRCSGLIYSTALPPPVLGAIDAALDLLPSLDAERAHVAALAERLRRGARSVGIETGASATQIVPLVAGDNHAALSLGKVLRESGIFATAIRPPTVPVGTARVRLAVTAAHTEADVDALLTVLEDGAAALRQRAAV